jgi:hypothetical protein
MVRNRVDVRPCLTARSNLIWCSIERRRVMQENAFIVLKFLKSAGVMVPIFKSLIAKNENSSIL